MFDDILVTDDAALVATADAAFTLKAAAEKTAFTAKQEKDAEIAKAAADAAKLEAEAVKKGEEAEEDEAEEDEDL